MKRYNKKIICKVFLVCSLFISSFILDISAYSKTLIPCGKTVGITVKTKGIRVIDTAEFDDLNGKSVSPAREAGIKSGDIILKINEREIKSAEDLSVLGKGNGKAVSVTVLRSGEELVMDVYPKQAKDGSFKLGVWAGDSESGIGTITYIDPDTREFGALGHGICHTENVLTDINGGSVLNVDLTSVKKGERGAPGELIGIFSGKEICLGEVDENRQTGVYGMVEDDFLNDISNSPVEVASRAEVNEGEVTVLSNIEGNEVREYSGKITRINDDETNTKGMIVKITDKELLEKTGGIVQGMSGSPILQNGKIVGAVTHVFVNDPTRGYGIFIENMLAEAEKIK